jgi:hypothetical protein
VGWAWSELVKVQELIDGGPDATCEQTLKKYKTHSVDYKKNKSKQSKEVFYRFADSFTENNNFFNTKAGCHSLDTETDFKIVQVPFVEGKQKFVQFCPFVFWKVAIDGDNKTHEDEEGINNLLSAFGHVTIQGTAVEDDDEEFFDE